MFQYPKKVWQVPCKYHDHSTRMVDDSTPVVLSTAIQELQVMDYTPVITVLSLSEAILKRLTLRQEGRDDRE